MDCNLNRIVNNISFFRTFVKYTICLTITFLPKDSWGQSLFMESLKQSLDTSSLSKASYEMLKYKRGQTYLPISDYLPNIKGNGGLKQHNDELITGRYKEKNYSIKGTLTQPIFDIERIINIAEARKNQTIEKENLLISQQDIIRDLIYLWVEFSYQKKIFKLSHLADSLSKIHLKSTENRYSNGDLTKTDIYQAEARSYSNHSNLQRESLYFEQLKINFITEFGNIITDSISIPKVNKFTFDKSNMDSVIETMPNFKILKEKLKIARLTLIKDITKNIPRLNAVGEVSRYWDKSDYSKPYPYNDLSIGLELSVNVWTSGKTIAGSISSNAFKKHEEFILNKTKTDLQNMVLNGLMEIDKLQKQQNEFMFSKESSEKSLEGVNIEFNIGNRNSMDVLDAQAELISVTKEYEKSKKILFLSYIDLFYDLGILNVKSLSNFLLQKGS